MDIFNIAEILGNMILAMFTGGFIALFSYLLDYCFWPQSIFKKWLPTLAEAVVSQEDYSEIKMLAPELQADEFMNRGQNYFLYKILGGCIICTNVWAAMFSYFLLVILTPMCIWYMPIHVVFSSYILRKIIS